jgi:DNA-binding FadR family transcriptional regulator
MLKKPARAARRTLQDLIIDYIVEDGLSPGDPLPTELQLMETFEVSRNAVREALRALQALGIVEIRHGYGTFVGSARLQVARPGLLFRAQLGGKAQLSMLADLAEVREVLEAGLIARTVEKASDDDIAALQKVVDQMAVGDNLAEYDREFHYLLFRPCENALVLELVRLFWDSYHDVQHLVDVPDNDRATIVQRHAMIVDAIKARDTAAALEAMRHHFDEVEGRVDRAINRVGKTEKATDGIHSSSSR